MEAAILIAGLILLLLAYGIALYDVLTEKMTELDLPLEIDTVIGQAIVDIVPGEPFIPNDQAWEAIYMLNPGAHLGQSKYVCAWGLDSMTSIDQVIEVVQEMARNMHDHFYPPEV